MILFRTIVKVEKSSDIRPNWINIALKRIIIKILKIPSNLTLNIKPLTLNTSYYAGDVCENRKENKQVLKWKEKACIIEIPRSNLSCKPDEGRKESPLSKGCPQCPLVDDRCARSWPGPPSHTSCRPRATTIVRGRECAATVAAQHPPRHIRRSLAQSAGFRKYIWIL